MTRERDPVSAYLTADHDVLDALLRRAERDGGAIDLDAYAEFRRGLLRHIGIDEKILFPAATRARGGAPLPATARLHLDHGALAALLVPTPTRDILRTIRALLAAHNAAEEEAGGVYAVCARLAGPGVDRLVTALRAAPAVPVSAHTDGERVLTAARRALARAGYDAAALGI